ncbi:hypothetical protein ACS0TY_000099 [Phlomoides rotata]
MIHIAHSGIELSYFVVVIDVLGPFLFYWHIYLEAKMFKLFILGFCVNLTYMCICHRCGFIHDSFMSSSGSLNGLEEQLQELFDEVKTMIKLGKEDDAIDLLEANYEAVREQVDSGVQGIEEAAVFDVIALGYMALGNLSTVGSVMDVLHKVVDALNNEELLLDSILMHMGNIYAKLKSLSCQSVLTGDPWKLWKENMELRANYFAHHCWEWPWPWVLVEEPVRL